MIEDERYGKRYLRCPDCDFGSFDEGYVRAHIDGVAHRAPQPPGAEAGAQFANLNAGEIIAQAAELTPTPARRRTRGAKK